MSVAGKTGPASPSGVRPKTLPANRVVTTERAADLLASTPTFDLNRSLAGRAFRRGEPVLDRPERAREPDESGSVIDRASLHVPLDGRGTLTVFGAGAGVSAQDIELVEERASLVVESLARAETPSEGDEPADGDERIYRLPMCDVVADASEAETREEVGRRTYERLVAADACGGAWFVSTDVGGEWRTIEASAGETDTPPESARQTETGTDSAGDDLVHRAVETGEICLVRSRQTVRDGSGDAEQDETTETTVAVPVSHADRTYGVLVLRSDSAADAPSHPQSKLEVLGDVVGLAVYAVENKRLLLSEKVQQLEFEVTDPDCLAVAVSGTTEAFCEIEHQTLVSNGNHLCYLQVEGTAPETAREVTAEVGPVVDCQIVETGDNGCLLEMVKTQSGAEAMMEVGATVRRATAESGAGTLVVETPLSADIRKVVDAYTAMNPGSHLVAKREIDRPVPTTDGLAESLKETFTEKQQSVLTAAYYAGYFEWPGRTRPRRSPTRSGSVRRRSTSTSERQSGRS